MSGRSSVYTFIGKDEFSGVAKDVGESAGGLGKKMGLIGKVGGAALAGGIGMAAGALAGAGVYMKGAIDDASNLSETMNKNSVVFGKQSKAIAAWADDAANKFGMTKQEALDATGSFGTMFSQIGFSGSQTKKMSTGLVELSADLASFHNLEGGAAEATDMLSSAMRGEYDSLQRVIPTINGTAVQQKALEMTGKAAAKSLTDQEKAAAVYQLAMEGAGPAVGDFARTSDGLANTQRRLGATMADLSAKAGTALLPVFTKVADFVLTRVIPVMQDWGEKIMPKLKDAWESIKQTIQENRPQLEKLGEILANVGKWVLENVVPALVKLNTFIFKNLIKAFAALGEVLPPIVAGMLDGAANIVGGFKDMYSAVTGVLEGILTVAEKTLGWIPGIGDKIKAAKAGFSDFRDDTVSKLGAVEAGLRTASDKVKEFGEKSGALPPTKLRAEVTDLEQKLATAKSKLSDPDLTKERKAELNAQIDKLEHAVEKAKDKIASVNGKTVTLGVEVELYGKKYYVQPGTNKHIPLFEAAGGLIRGPGTGTSDQIPAYLSNGEYVMRASAVQRYGSAFFDALNSGTSTGGGGGTSGPVGAGVTVNVYGGLDSAETIARTVQRALLDLKRRQGVSLGLA